MRRGGALLCALLAVSGGLWIAPLPPPTRVPPLSLPSTRLSPILTEPGPLIRTPALPRPSVPALASPSPLDSQKLDAYRFDLENRERALERGGVSPADPRSREVEEELQRLRSGTGGP
jgi:hypothetical protein